VGVSKAVGQETHLTLDIDGGGANLLVELVYEKPERNNSGRHGGSGSGLDVAGIHLPVGGAATVTIAYSRPAHSLHPAGHGEQRGHRLRHGTEQRQPSHRRARR
jgi:hypothetical protein